MLLFVVMGRVCRERDGKRDSIFQINYHRGTGTTVPGTVVLLTSFIHTAAVPAVHSMV